MRSPIFRIIVAVLGLGAAARESAAFSATAAIPAAEANAPFAVVELFTSEGCSSCPPADQLLSDLAAEAEKSGKPVYALSFHVDYWNHLGWADPFSRAEFTDRQKRYSRYLDGRVYTPQMIVNGSEEFVGSQGVKARKSIDGALEKNAEASILIEPGKIAGGRLDVAYGVAGQREGDWLNLAVVEKGMVVPVKHGENGGRTLRHYNVVRAFRTVHLDAKGSGSAHLDLPQGMCGENTQLIAYVQKAGTFKAIGATRAALDFATAPASASASASAPTP
jgi:hypothetical protein